MNKTNDQIMKKQIYFMLKVNNITYFKNDLEELINNQGIEKVFNNFYRNYYSFGNIISKRNNITEITKKRLKSK